MERTKMNKWTHKTIKYTQQDKNCFYKPVITIKNKNIEATYYYDGSGEITLLDKGHYFYHKEDGKLKHQIKDIEEHIIEMQKHIGIFRQSLKVLKQEQKKHKLL